MQFSSRPIFVAGATGYIGGRLVPRLLDAGYPVRVLARSADKLLNRPWGQHPKLTFIRGDVLDSVTLKQALNGCRAAYYLIHSMNPDVKDFSETDRLAANNMAAEAAAEGLDQIIYLSGLGEQKSGLSHHLRSRTEVGEILRQGSVPVTILRAAMIIGSGSASFEILRYLVDRLPVMVTPRWVDTPCQPISIRNVLYYLLGCLEKKEVIGRTFDIDQTDILDYRQLMKIYAEEANLPKRWIIPVPVLTPRLSSYWIHLVTPVPASIARPLAEGLSNPVICQENRIRDILPQELFDARKAIRLALNRMEQQTVETSWIDSGRINPAEWSDPGDPAWAGGSAYVDSRKILLNAQPEDIWPAINAIGGKVGYYYADWLWEVRGFIDRIIGGVGLCRGRRSSKELFPGDVVDFWRVTAIEKNACLILFAEMKLPGEAVLSFRLKRIADGETELTQIARFLPRGLFGLLYWYLVMPFHHFIFNGMLRGICKASGKEAISSPIKD